LGSRSDDRNIDYKVPGTGLDLWRIFGTLTLVAFVLAFAMIVWQGQHTAGPTSHQTPTDHIVLIASPQPTVIGTPTPELTSTPPPSAQLVDTGVAQLPAAPPTRATVAPTPSPTPAPKPTATHQPPTAMLKTISGGLKGAQVTADASFSWDATGIVSYHFNWGDGITSGPQSSPTATHTYSSSGTWTITLTVVDSVGLASSTSTTVSVG
jgi:hypothetical protein